ncbi:DNA primase [Microseira wollei]|uniref:DNA primase n=1 Tax=Microseira wollei NIES-4236 TaxID=2530354 RepID=A0AAV3X9Z5_9CYAN|nr:DNA primase [Microseira wollei]GET38196.1 DNA primase [Microseira wollei NIES-4236]
MQNPRLHPDTIEEVKQRADIVDVISEHVVLRKRGKDFVGLCPFHTEKSPSFTVSPSKQMYYCFGCQAGGGTIKFLMELGKQSFGDVVLELAQRYQVPIKTLQAEQRQELQRQLSLREQLYEILALTARFYEHALRQSQGHQALEYLQSQRRLRQETIQHFQLGYAPAGWETLYRYLVEDKHYPVQLLEQAGLIRRRREGEGYYDYFRDRIIIPICDTSGRVIGFGGRTLTNEQPKYLNSPETELFNKGKTLFALDQAKNAIAKLDQGIVVEGYFDAIALHAVGITNAVASLGTALSLAQVRQLLRYTESKQLVLNFDADAAGTNAASRAIGEIADLAYAGEVQLRILNIPDGKDADEFLNSSSDGGEKYRHLLETAPLWLDWQIQLLIKDQNLKQADQYQRVVQQMVKLLAQIPNLETRNLYINRCAEILSKGELRLVPNYAQTLLGQIKRNQRQKSTGVVTKQPAETVVVQSDRDRLLKAEGLLLRIFLHCPEHRQAVIQALQERDLQFSLSHHRFLWAQILDLQATNSLEDLDLLSKLQDRCLEFKQEMAQVQHLFHLDEKTQLDIYCAEELIQSAVACQEKVMCEKQYSYFSELLKKTDPTKETERWQYFVNELYKTKQRLKELNRKLNFAVGWVS